jgi:hypothetical protein
MNIIKNIHKKVRIIDVIDSIMKALEQFDGFDATVTTELFKENQKMNDKERTITGLVTLIIGNLGENADLSEQEVDSVIRFVLKIGREVRKRAKNRIM